MRILNPYLLFLLAGLLAACSSTKDGQKGPQVDYRSAATRAKPLEVPPDLTMPVASDRYGIPGADGVARYSDYARSGGSSINVLPVQRTAQLMRNDSQRWLLVNEKPEKVWTLVRAFWLENGLVLKMEQPEAGVMETDWAENRAKSPAPARRSVFDKLYEGTTTGERDQYHVRLERSKDGGTEIHIRHSGLREVRDGYTDYHVAIYKWVARDTDPELEATMLQLLMAKLVGVTQIPVAGQPAAQPSLVQMQTAADGSKKILLGEPFDKSWRKLTLALDQARLSVEDRDRSKGMLYLRPAKQGEAALQLLLKEVGSGCEVVATDGQGKVTPEAQRLIDTLLPILSKL